MGRLKKCRDCGHAMSGRAGACPSCGAPAKSKPGCLSYLFAMALFIGGFFFVCNKIMTSPAINDAMTESPEEAKLKEEDRALAKAAEEKRWKAACPESKQKARKKLIQEMMRSGVLQKVESPGGAPRIWVDPAFYALDFDEKKTLIEVVAAYYACFNRDDMTPARVLDGKTGNEIGSFDAYGGLDLD